MQIKFTRDFYNPLARKKIEKDSIIIIEDEAGIPLDGFWRGILKDNEITNIIVIITEESTKKKK